MLLSKAENRFRPAPVLGVVCALAGFGIGVVTGRYSQNHPVDKARAGEQQLERRFDSAIRTLQADVQLTPIHGDGPSAGMLRSKASPEVIRDDEGQLTWLLPRVIDAVKHEADVAGVSNLALANTLSFTGQASLAEGDANIAIAYDHTGPSR